MFSNVVALYRAIGAPTIEDGVIRYEGMPTPDIIGALRMCDGLPLSLIHI